MGMFSDLISSGGSWSISSEADPRWNISGRAAVLGFCCKPQEAESKIDELKKTLGEPPSDLRFSYFKD